MKKIPTVFLRDPENMKNVLSKINPECAWVFEGEGIATRKFDGTCCLVREGVLYKRRVVKKGKLVPDDFEQADYDPVTGKTVGWIPVGDGPEDRYHLEALSNIPLHIDGTHELIGPKVQGNPENYKGHFLIPHKHAERYPAMNRPQDFDELKTALTNLSWEGLVWHHPDGRMAKLKKRDFQ